MEEAILREFSDRHGDFVAGVASGAMYAIFHYFVAQGLMVYGVETEVLEECGDAGEEADAVDSAGFGLIEEGSDEQASGSVPLGVGVDDDGADLGEMLAVDVECSATQELVGVGFDDGEGADVLADLGVGAVEEGAVVGAAFDELMDGAGVVQLRFTCPQGCCFEFVFGEGSCEGRGRRFLYEGQCHMPLRFSSFRVAMGRSG
jgi:hypothetical protein